MWTLSDEPGNHQRVGLPDQSACGCPVKFSPWQAIRLHRLAGIQTKQENDLPDFIAHMADGTTSYEAEIRTAWEAFKLNPTEAKAKEFIAYLKSLSDNMWPEVMAAILGIGVEELTADQHKVLADALAEHHGYMEESLLPDVTRAAQLGRLDQMDYRTVVLYAGALWQFGNLATVMFDGLNLRDLADLFMFAGPNDSETCTGPRGCQSHANNVYAAAQILTEDIIPGRMRCLTNCRHFLLPIASPLKGVKKHQPGRHSQDTHTPKAYGGSVENRLDALGIELKDWRKGNGDGASRALDVALDVIVDMKEHDAILRRPTLDKPDLVSDEPAPELREIRLRDDDTYISYSNGILSIGIESGVDPSQVLDVDHAISSADKSAKATNWYPDQAKSDLRLWYPQLVRHELGHWALDSKITREDEHVWIGVYDTNKKALSDWNPHLTKTYSEMFAESYATYNHPQYRRGMLPSEVELFFDEQYSQEQLKHQAGRHPQDTHTPKAYGKGTSPESIPGMAEYNQLAKDRQWARHPIMDDSWNVNRDIAPGAKAGEKKDGKFGLCAYHSLNAYADDPSLKVMVGIEMTDDDQERLVTHDHDRYWEPRFLGTVHVWNEDSQGRVVDNAVGSRNAKKWKSVYIGKEVPKDVLDGFADDGQLLNYAHDTVNASYPVGTMGEEEYTSMWQEWKGRKQKHLQHDQSAHTPHRYRAGAGMNPDYTPLPLDQQLIDEIDRTHGPWDATGLAEEIGAGPEFAAYAKSNSRWTQGADSSAKPEIEYMLEKFPTVRTLSLYEDYSSRYGGPDAGDYPTFRDWLDTEDDFYRFGPIHSGMSSFARSKEGARDAANAFPDDEPIVLRTANKNLLGSGMTGIGEVYVDGSEVEYAATKHMAGKHDQRWHTPHMLRGRATVWKRKGEHLEETYAHLNLDEDMLADMFWIPGADSQKIWATQFVHQDGNEHMLNVTVQWYTPGGKNLGIVSRTFHKDADGKLVVVNDQIGIVRSGQGTGAALYKNQINMLTDRGYDRIELHANSTIGRYAWARKGFDVKDDWVLDRANERFPDWLGKQELTAEEVGWTGFTSAKQIADFNPGPRVDALDIFNEEVPEEMTMHVGKAFMLDMAGEELDPDGIPGMGSWQGVLELQ